jgi:hypothetical protein
MLTKLQLRRRIDRLQERIEELETLLGLNDELPDNFVTGYRGAPMTALVNLFVRRPLVTCASVASATGYSEGTVKVCMVTVRKMLREQCGIELRNQHGEGWYLTAADRARLREIIAAGVRVHHPYPYKRKDGRSQDG